MAPAYALARGWERQLDTKVNGLFYEGTLDRRPLRGVAAPRGHPLGGAA